MKKKPYIFTLILGGLLIFAILPLINYKTDITRILHQDYTHQYHGIDANRLYLKVSYLLEDENKGKYDTLIFGSSRGANIEMARISPTAYNMSHGFGTVSTYRHMLKTLLDHGFKAKEVWIGINDFDIWKDNTNDRHKFTYKNTFSNQVEFYSDWLFREIDAKTIKLLNGDIKLIESTKVTDPDNYVAKHARAHEKKIRHSKNRNFPGAMLGYTQIHRVDKAIEDIKAIKELSDEHNITLKAFMYPTYYKTYVHYNQFKINEFKFQLAQIMPFYDFYSLDELAFTTYKWEEGSHFVPSVGDFIIDTLKEEKSLVTKENVQVHLNKNKQKIKNLFKYIPENTIYRTGLHLDIDLSKNKLLFDFSDSSFTYTPNKQLRISKENNMIHVQANTTDPHIILEDTKVKSKSCLLQYKMLSPIRTVFKLYYKKNDKYVNKYTIPVNFHKGLHEFGMVFPCKYMDNGLRVDFAQHKGEYKIHTFTIHEFDQAIPHMTNQIKSYND